MLKLVLSVAVLMMVACGASKSPASPVTYRGLMIEFMPQCVDGEIVLRGEITNSSNHPITIESGALPWQYDLLGTDFQAEVGGKKLQKNPTAPLIGKTGPKTLEPTERRHGFTPVEFLFPELRSLLNKQSVIIQWSYSVSRPLGGEDGRVRGVITVPRNPCEN